MWFSPSRTPAKISPQLAATLGEPFLRGTRRIRTEHAGVGLGLAIVKSITQAHDGTLTLSPPGRWRAPRHGATARRARMAVATHTIVAALIVLRHGQSLDRFPRLAHANRGLKLRLSILQVGALAPARYDSEDFLDAYRNAFEAFDASAVADLFTYPCQITSDAGEARHSRRGPAGVDKSPRTAPRHLS